MINNTVYWNRISIIDPNGLPGKSIADAIKCIQRSMNFKFVIIDDIIGAKISVLLDKENTIMEIKDLLEIINEVIQFDWGDFFLFQEYPKNWENFKGLSYPDLVRQTDTTVRAIDDTYIYVYTPFQEIVNILKENYQIESMKTDFLENLDYPY